MKTEDTPKEIARGQVWEGDHDHNTYVVTGVNMDVLYCRFTHCNGAWDGEASDYWTGYHDWTANWSFRGWHKKTLMQNDSTCPYCDAKISRSLIDDLWMCPGCKETFRMIAVPEGLEEKH